MKSPLSFAVQRAKPGDYPALCHKHSKSLKQASVPSAPSNTQVRSWSQAESGAPVAQIFAKASPGLSGVCETGILGAWPAVIHSIESMKRRRAEHRSTPQSKHSGGRDKRRGEDQRRINRHRRPPPADLQPAPVEPAMTRKKKTSNIMHGWWRCRASNPGHYGYEPYALTD